MRALETIAGVVLVALVLGDVFRSVVLPRATKRTLRLGPGLGRGMLAVLIWVAGRRPARRHAILGSLGPLLIVIEAIIWVLLLVLGYALLLHASEGLRPQAGFDTALYAAASAFFTTGLSGMEAQTGLARTMVSVAAFSGLAVVTLVVTFLLSVQGALQRGEALVLLLRVRTGPGPTGVGLLERMTEHGQRRQASMDALLAAWEAWAADVLLTHRAFPILGYFRSTDEDCGWMAALGAVLDASALLCVLPGEDPCGQAARTHRMGARLIADMARQFGLEAPYAPLVDRATFEAALGRLAAAEYACADPGAAWDLFAALRARHAPPLAAMAERFGEVDARLLADRA